MGVNKKATSASGSNPDASQDPLIGRQFGDYKLTSLLAAGGMARIYKGMDSKLQRQAAVKVLAHGSSSSDKTLTKRFLREARAVAALEHDNIITIYQTGEQDGVYFLAMKLVKGKDLAQELKRLKRSSQKMDVGRALRILEQVASALDFAHKQEVIHRDIKPSNILLDENDKAVLTDFGLVLRVSHETTMGTAFGTPRYIAPEQATSSNKAVPQSDIYSLGIILYEIFTGDTPFSGESPMEIALSQISDPPPSPRSRNPEIPAAVERELLKALDKEPEKRHKTATEFIQAVKRGYGLATADVPLAKTTGEISTVTSPSISQSSGLHEAWPSVGSQASTPKLDEAWPTGSTARVSAPRTHPKWLLPAVVIVLLALAAIAVVALGGGGQTPGDNQAPVITGGDGAPITLFYDETSFSMYNGGDYDLNVGALQFIRGIDDSSDDYAGDRVRGDSLPARSCFRVYLQDEPAPAPAQCQDRIQSGEGLYESARFFWRTETPDDGAVATFEVWYERQVIARCDTVARGGSPKECRFNWPVVPPPTEESSG